MTSAKEIGSTFTIDDSKFEAGATYCIESARDNNAHTDKWNDWIDLYYGKLDDGNKIRMWPGNGAAAQKWRVELDDEEDVPRGHFLCTPCSADLKRVITLKPRHQNNKVVLEEYKGKLEQLWFYVPVASTGKFAIVSAYNGKALSNQGREENLRCIDIDPDDINQQWLGIKV